MATEARRSIVQPVEKNEKRAATTCRATFALEGMTCASCAMRIEKGLKKVPGVTDAQVNFATEEATVTYDPEQTGLEQMVQKVEAVGYKATPLDQPLLQPVQPKTVEAAAADIHRKRNLLILGIVLTLPVVILSMFFMNSFAFENYL